MCRRLGFNYLTGTLPAELYSLFTTGKEWWKKYERPPPLSRPDQGNMQLPQLQCR